MRGGRLHSRGEGNPSMVRKWGWRPITVSMLNTTVHQYCTITGLTVQNLIAEKIRAELINGNGHGKNRDKLGIK